MSGVRSELGPTAQAVAEAVRRHRDRMGWGYARLSRELTKIGRDIPPLGLGRIESGTRRVDVDDLTALAVVFGVSPVSLLMPARDNRSRTPTSSSPGPTGFPVSVHGAG